MVVIPCAVNPKRSLTATPIVLFPTSSPSILLIYITLIFKLFLYRIEDKQLHNNRIKRISCYQPLPFHEPFLLHHVYILTHNFYIPHTRNQLAVFVVCCEVSL